MKLCKFQLKDQVRVVEPTEHHFDEVGIITDRDPNFVVCYRVKFPSGLTGYFRASHLVLAPSEGEFQ